MDKHIFCIFYRNRLISNNTVKFCFEYICWKQFVSFITIFCVFFLIIWLRWNRVFSHISFLFFFFCKILLTWSIIITDVNFINSLLSSSNAFSNNLCKQAIFTTFTDIHVAKVLSFLRFLVFLTKLGKKIH